jgi:hypothetical protein
MNMEKAYLDIVKVSLEMANVYLYMLKGLQGMINAP